MNNHAERIILKRETEVGWGEIREKEQTDAREWTNESGIEHFRNKMRDERNTSIILSL